MIKTPNNNTMCALCSYCEVPVPLLHSIKICASTIFYNETCPGCGRKIRFECKPGTQEYVCTGERATAKYFEVECPVCEATLTIAETNKRRSPLGADEPYIYIAVCKLCNTQVVCEKINDFELSVVHFYSTKNPNI
jgi:hypothetical protein